MSSTQRVSLPLNRVEMDKHMDSGQYVESLANHCGSCASTNTEVRGQTHELGNEGDIESGRIKMMTAGKNTTSNLFMLTTCSEIYL
jgi:hypothetical protein